MELVFMLATALALLSEIRIMKISSAQGFKTPCLTPNNQPGDCVELQKCNILYTKIINNVTDSLEFVKASSCGPTNEDRVRRRVCCGAHDNYINRIFTFGAPVSYSSKPSDSKLPQDCGIQNIIDSRIYGGNVADVSEFPWMARLKHRSKYNFMAYGCSGFLIHKHYILTAAHCLTSEAENLIGPLIEVELGIHNDTGGNDCISDQGKTICKRQTLKVDIHISHKNYEPKHHMNDIALIGLRHGAVISNFIKPICLSRNSIDQNELWLAGWGRTETDATSSTLLKVTVPRVDIATCAERYRLIEPITDTQLCAGGVGGRDSCAGDSGGPLMAKTENNVWYAEGIVSYGSGCGKPKWPGVYTNVPKYIDWITDTIKHNDRSRNELYGEYK